MIHVLPGFLGKPEDFSFLPQNQVICHDLLNLKLRVTDLTSEDVLIGYSMGGRWAMEHAVSAAFKLKKLILISAHPGLRTADEKMQRLEWESEVHQKMQTLSPHEFLRWWNALPLFRADLPLTQLDPKTYDSWAKLFWERRLSEQPCYLDLLEQHRSQVSWIVGSHDARYAQIAQELLVPRNIPVHLISGGHRLFQEPKKILEVLRQENVL